MALSLDIGRVVVRSAFSFGAILLVTRLLGHQQISQMSFFNYVAGITMGTIAGSLAVDIGLSPALPAAGLAVFGVLTFLNELVSLRSVSARAVLDGEPLVMIQNGNILERNLAKDRLNTNELLTLLRGKGIFDPSQVELAILETDGTLSVMKKTKHQPVTRVDLGVAVKPEHKLPTEVVVDGMVLDENLAAIGRDPAWLDRQLNAKGVANVDEVSLAMVSSSGRLLIDLDDRRTRWQ